jgi:hypothetical protein
MFPDRESTIARYIMRKYRVLPRVLNCHGQTAEALALSFNLSELADFFAEVSTKESRRNRLVTHLPESVMKVVMEFL